MQKKRVLYVAENESSHKQVDIQPDNIVCQSDKRPGSQGGVYFHPVEQQGKGRPENRSEQDHDEQGNRYGDGHGKRFHVEKLGEYEYNRGTDRRIDKRAANFFHDIFEPVF